VIALGEVKEENMPGLRDEVGLWGEEEDDFFLMVFLLDGLEEELEVSNVLSWLDFVFFFAGGCQVNYFLMS
jgi:hypothetical protein